MSWLSKIRKLSLLACTLLILASLLSAQETQQADPSGAALTDRERLLLERVAKLEERVEALESKLASGQNAAQATPPPPAAPISANAVVGAPVEPANTPVASPASAGFLNGTTINLGLDTYYGYNTNNPIGRVNLLRPYDVSSNAVSLSQASLIFDNQPNVAAGKRWGFRLDLQYGQATETLQGNPLNEPRPDIYRNIFQAYGTYVVPIGKGLTVDVGKFASSLGYEGNYTKDQINYSRGLWFTLLPFYHAGARLNYEFTKAFGVSYWVVNGTQQTEPFNGYKDESFGVTIKPRKSVVWNINYYLGQEHPDVQYFTNGNAPPNAPTLQGVPFEPISDAPRGKLHIFDTWASWQASTKWLLAGEADYELQRLNVNSAPLHSTGAALWAQYRLTSKVALGGRAEYLSDRGGLFSGATQALKETTLTAKYQVADGLDLFGEWRRDFSNQPYFYTDRLGRLKREQNTATIGLVWWLGGKQGSW